MPEIRQLPPSVVNKIAAGEVIERPASVVKELLENSVDAGATRVDVSVAQGGLDLIRVVDNGCGMRPDQFSLAVASHATSKIDDADDLFRVGTLGFRGEALASIAEVSQLTMRSRTAEASSGAELEVLGGRIGEVRPCGCSVGTTLEVKHLFFNTPVRRKFMRTTQTEMGHASEAFTRIALAFPQVHFTLRHNEKTVYDLPAATDVQERVATFFGADIAQSLIAIEGSDEHIQLTGYVADPQFSRANNRLQYFFLNGRHIRDRALQHALGEAYRGLLLTGRYPIAFLSLAMPPSVVDVNVHPTKLEVRFQDSGRVYSQLLGSLRKKFLTTDLTARVGNTADGRSSDSGAPIPDSPIHSEDHLAAHRRELVDWAKGQLAEVSRGAETKCNNSQFAGEANSLKAASRGLDLRFDDGNSAALTLHRLVNRAPSVGPPLRTSASAMSSAAIASRPVNAESLELEGSAFVSRDDAAEQQGLAAQQAAVQAYLAAVGNRGIQIQNRYIVTETSQGMEIIDQHALHERILYEQIREKVLAGKLESQRLLVPEPVTLTAGEAAAAVEATETLRQLGIEIEPFGGDTILVSSYPAMLGRLNPAEILRSAVERLTAGGEELDRRDLLDELLHMCSCKAAIKAGDYLAPEEIAALLQQRHGSQDAHHCPHGRPTALVFTREELDRRFKRT